MKNSLPRIFYLHQLLNARRLVDRVENNHVEMPLYSVGLNGFSLQNRGSERIDLQGKLVHPRKMPVQRAPRDFSHDPPLLIKRVRGRKRNPAFASLHKNKGRERGAVGGAALNDQAAWKLQAKGYAFLYILESPRIVAPGLRDNLGWILAGEPPAGVHAIDAEVHHPSAARHRRVQKPGRRNTRVEVLAEGSVDHIDPAESAAAHQGLQEQCGGFKILAVG